MAQPGRSAFDGAAVPEPPIPDDDGRASPDLRRELDLLAAGQGSGDRTLRALAAARLFVPVVAVLEESETDADGLQHEKSSSMATVLVDSPEHGTALLAFSSIAAMSSWRADARPVAVLAPLAARAAVSEAADSLVVDVAGPTSFALNGTELLLMAAVAAPTGTGPDPALDRAVERVLAATPGAGGARAEVGSASPDRPVPVSVEGVPDVSCRTELVERLSRDRAVATLAPGGLHVSFCDTP